MVQKVRENLERLSSILYSSEEEGQGSEPASPWKITWEVPKVQQLKNPLTAGSSCDRKAWTLAQLFSQLW
jgi:hypothetical protein